MFRIQILIEPHCNENTSYVYPEKELHGLSPNFHILVSVSDLYIPRIGPYIFKAAQFHFWEYLLEFSVMCLCSAYSIRL